MKFVLRCTLLVMFTLGVNTVFAVSSVTLNPPIESETGKKSFKKKAKDFVQKRMVKPVKREVQKVKDSWNAFKKEQKKGVGFGTVVLLLTVAFVVLKLVGVIAWSWFWVLSPLWITVGLVILLLLVALIGVSAMKNK